LRATNLQEFEERYGQSKSDGMPPRVMVDATVLFAGAGCCWSYEYLRHASMGDFDLVLSPLVIEQARRNLKLKVPHVAGVDSWLEMVRFDLVPDPKPEEVAKMSLLFVTYQTFQSFCPR
jgi:hypothetical protein